jgi:hypothetical protein
MYEMTLSGKYWYQDLMEVLAAIGFTQSTVIRFLFFQRYKDGTVIFVLNYVDDMLYFGTSNDSLLSFEIKLAKCFNMDTSGQAYWNLAIRITQMISS